MRILLALLPLVCFGQGSPVIGSIDYYGLQNVPVEKVQSVLGVAAGSRLPASKGEVEERLEEIEGVVAARIEAACCEDGKAILYIGIEERGGPHFDYRDPPEEDLHLPAAIVETYRAFLDAVRDAGRDGAASEDLTRGHSLMPDPATQKLQLQFVGMANSNLDQLRNVLRNAADPEERAIAAYVIGYADDKPSVHNDLQYALQDVDETVRANALRAVAAFAVLARTKPDSGVKVSTTWITEMLNSLAWTDRNNAAVALVTLTEHRDADALDQLRTRAMQSLTDMSRWKHLPHALPAFILMGRIAGMPEEAIQKAWNSGDRETVIKAALSKKR